MTPGEAVASPPDAPGPKRHRWRRNQEDVDRWAALFKSGVTIVPIAERFGVAPSTVSKELHRLGFSMTPGHHMVEQLPLELSPQLVELVDKGPDSVLEFVKGRVWGIQASPFGERQLRSFCEFVRLHHAGVGVLGIADRLSVHRSTVAQWRNGTDYPYLIRATNDTLPITPRTGWRMLPMHLLSGGGEPSGWVQVPRAIRSYAEIEDVIRQIQPLELTYTRAKSFGLEPRRVQAIRSELFAYILGIMVGDSAKLGGEQPRYASMNLDLQLTLKQPSNGILGEFVLMCANSLGLMMERKKDKPPTGRQLLGKDPSPAYRWVSERSPLIAWVFSVGLGLNWGETTTTHQVRMSWIYKTPRMFRIRFVQGVADSDGCAKGYEIEIASVPNARFFADILQSLGLTSAHVSYEKGEPLKTMVSMRQASTLPIFNEFVGGYRYRKMMRRYLH